MAMTDEEILSAAGRLRAAKRRRVAKICPVCGTPFEGVAQRRYCSAACRVRAARGQDESTPVRGAALATHPDEGTNPGAPGRRTKMDDENALAQSGPRDGEIIPALPRAGGQRQSSEADGPAPRGDGEPLAEYFERVSTYLAGGRVSTEDAVEDVRLSRQQRTLQWERAIAPSPAARTIGRDEADAILARLDRTREAIMRGRVFNDDSTALVRRERARRSADLRRRSGS